MKQLDGNLPVSLYYQLKQDLLGKIAGKEWRPGDKIPNEFELCREYGVSRITVRQALAELEKEGRLIRRQGKGTFVAIPRIEQNLASFYSLSEEFKKRGYSPSNKVLDFCLKAPPADIAEKLGLKGETDRAIYLRRLRFADEMPMAVEFTYLPADLFPGLTKTQLEHKALYDIMREDYGVIPVAAEESIGAVEIGDMEAAFFKTEKGRAAFEIERIAYSSDRCVEYAKGVVRGDVFRFHVRLA